MESSVFEATLFSLSASTYFSFAMTLFSPTLFLVLVYSLGLSLDELPFIGKIENYRPPNFVLPLAAVSTLFVMILCVSAGCVLRFYSVQGDQESSFSKLSISRNLIRNDPYLNTAEISVLDYDNDSHFGIYVNGYRILGSHVDCLISQSCNKNGLNLPTSHWFKPEWSVRNLDIRSLDKIDGDFMQYVIIGENIIDLVSSNSGTGGCNLAIKIRLSNEYYNIIIKADDIGYVNASQIHSSSLLNSSTETFYSASPVFKKFYGTDGSQLPGRLCQRLKIRFTVNSGEMRFDRIIPKSKTSDIFIACLMMEQKRKKVCGYSLNDQDHCRGEFTGCRRHQGIDQ